MPGKTYWSRFGKAIAERDFPNGKMKCKYCGTTVWDNSELWIALSDKGDGVISTPTNYEFLKKHFATIDHVIPLCKGGSDDLENLVIACMSCNSRKGSK